MQAIGGEFGGEPEVGRLRTSEAPGLVPIESRYPMMSEVASVNPDQFAVSESVTNWIDVSTPKLAPS